MALSETKCQRSNLPAEAVGKAVLPAVSPQPGVEGTPAAQQNEVDRRHDGGEARGDAAPEEEGAQQQPNRGATSQVPSVSPTRPGLPP